MSCKQKRLPHPTPAIFQHPKAWRGAILASIYMVNAGHTAASHTPAHGGVLEVCGLDSHECGVSKAPHTHTLLQSLLLASLNPHVGPVPAGSSSIYTWQHVFCLPSACAKRCWLLRCTEQHKLFSQAPAAYSMLATFLIAHALHTHSPRLLSEAQIPDASLYVPKAVKRQSRSLPGYVTPLPLRNILSHPPVLVVSCQGLECGDVLVAPLCLAVQDIRQEGNEAQLGRLGLLKAWVICAQALDIHDSLIIQLTDLQSTVHHSMRRVG